MNYLLVFIGGGVGCMMRFFISNKFPSANADFPIATFLSNALSSFILGVLMGYLMHRNVAGDNIRLFVVVGFCGGFSTFSTFSYETFTLLSLGSFKAAAVSVFLNLIICYAAVAVGFIFTKNTIF
jgi:CrcB protein